MNVHPCKHRLVCLLMCFSLIAGLLPSVPASAQALTETAPTETEAYNIYKDEFGLPQMISTCPITNETASLTHIEDGRPSTWYSLYDDLTVSALTVSGGPINLILCDGATLTADAIQVETDSSLTVWGQPVQSGKLVTSSVTSDLTFNGGILETADKLNVIGSLTLNGGKLSAKGLEVGKNLTVNSGFLDSTGTVQAGQNVTVNGGFVTASARPAIGLHADGNLTIKGGQIESSFDCGGTASVTNAIIISDKAGFPNAINSGVLAVSDNAESEKLTGTVTGNPTISTDLVVLNNMTLDIPAGQTLTMAEGTTLTNLGTVTGEGNITCGSVVNAKGCAMIERVSPAAVTTAKPLSKYKTDTDSEEEYSIGDSSIYVLDQDLTMDKLIITNGAAPTLILPNGLTLRTGSVGLPIAAGHASGTENKSGSTAYTLTLSKQSGPFGMLCYNSESKNSTAMQSNSKKVLSFNKGNLIVEGGMVSGDSAAIEVPNLTVNGGTVSSTTIERNSIIVSDILTVNGGSIQGTSQEKVGIYAEHLTVNGGSVTGQNMKNVESSQDSTEDTSDIQKNCGIAGNYSAKIFGGIVASRDSRNGEPDLSYKNNNITISGGVLLCCDMFNVEKTTVENAVIMAKTLSLENFLITSGITFSGESGNLMGVIMGSLDESSCTMVYPVINTGFTIPERAILKIDPNQELNLASGAVLHNKGDIVNQGTITGGEIKGNAPISPIDTYYMKDGVRTKVKAMVLDQKLLELYGQSLPQDFLYILKENSLLELNQNINSPLKLILADEAEIHLKPNGHSVFVLEIWGQEQNTGKLIHEDPLAISNSLALHGGTLSFVPDESETASDGTLTTDSLTVTGGVLCENGITVDEADVTLTGGTIRCTGEAMGLKLKNGSLNTTKEDGTPGTGWLTGTVQIGNDTLTDFSSYTGVFIHDNVEEVRGVQALYEDYAVPADHTMTVYGTLDIPETAALTVSGTLKLADGAVLTREGVLQVAAPVTLAVKNGSWSDGTTDNKIAKVLLTNEEVRLTGPMTVSCQQEQDIRDQLPTDMKAAPGYKGGSWDNTIIAGDNPMLTYAFAAIPSSSNETEPKLPKLPKPPVVPELKPGETVTETRPDGTKMEASRDENGSITVTETKKDGTVVKYEEKINGDKEITETKKDGSSVREEKRANGDTLITVTAADGSSTTEAKKPDGTTSKSQTTAEGVTSSETKVSGKAMENALRENRPVELPLPPVKPAEQGEEETAPIIRIELPETKTGKNTEIKVTTPLAAEDVTGTVAVIVRKDGTEEIIRKASLGSDSITIPLEESAAIRLMNNAKQFDDVPKTHWAWKEITAVTANEIFNGTGDGLFRPDEGMSRGMLAVVFHNLENNPDGAKADFSDVKPGKWYTEAIGWAAENGIVDGVGGGKFAPDDMLTREQLAVMLYRYSGSAAAAKEHELTFPDSGNVSAWASDAMAWAVEQGIITGMDDGSLSPQGTASRAQVATMLMRFINK